MKSEAGSFSVSMGSHECMENGELGRFVPTAKHRRIIFMASSRPVKRQWTDAHK